MVQEGEVALIPVSPEINVPVVAGDTVVASDSIDVLQPPSMGIMLTPPEPLPQTPPLERGNIGVSFIISGLFLIFLIVGLRYRNNIKYTVTMFHNLVETRTRHNVFDDTVKEASLIVLLNVLWCACIGIIGFCVFQYFNPGIIEYSFRSVGMLVGMALAVGYTVFMWIAYSCVGWVFSDREHADLWVKGFSASQALMSPALFVIALVAICRPETALNVAIVTAIVFVCGKLIFIWKGYRIFFNQFSSWVLFLCYLCSLEIVPLILCYRCAVLLGEVL